jgi:hypothetical protein
MRRVELEDGPVGGVEEGGVDSSLEEERLPAWSECHAEVVFVLTCDVEIANDTAMAIL